MEDPSKPGEIQIMGYPRKPGKIQIVGNPSKSGKIQNMKNLWGNTFSPFFSSEVKENRDSIKLSH